MAITVEVSMNDPPPLQLWWDDHPEVRAFTLTPGISENNGFTISWMHHQPYQNTRLRHCSRLLQFTTI